MQTYYCVYKRNQIFLILIDCLLGIFFTFSISRYCAGGILRATRIPGRPFGRPIWTGSLRGSLRGSLIGSLRGSLRGLLPGLRKIWN